MVRAIAERLPPWNLYRMKSTGQRCTIAAIAEDGTVRVDVTGEFNLIMFGRSVFGIDPNDLEVCDPPGDDEPVGEMMSQKDVEDNRDVLRCMVRPDLFDMGPDGKAHRKDN